jgi:hypothetical protein
MTWWIASPKRFARERDEIAALAESSASLMVSRWHLKDNLVMAVDVEVSRGAEWQPLTLTYPEFFPTAAPDVTPTDGRRLSGHQYGDGGELCLELRPDNWEPDFTGAMMLASAVKLLSGEAAGPEAPPLPSAHASTLGQRSRGRSCRFLLSPGVSSRLAGMAENTALPIEVSEHVLRGNQIQWLARVQSIGSGEEKWRDPTVVPGHVVPGLLVRVDKLDGLPAMDTMAGAEAFLAMVGRTDFAQTLQTGAGSMALVVGDATSAQAWWFFTNKDDQRDVLAYLTIEEPDDRASRLPPAYDSLGSKTVALVGCGSLGSKIAGSLARAGVGTFVLVDDDLVTLGNLVRQDYPVETVGGHKVDALVIRLKAINPSVVVKVRRIKLGGQEAANVTSSVLEQLAECDVIVDASGNPKVFNLCGAVATAKRKPIVWAEVLAGGIGGFVGRARPDQDPPPHLIRRQLAFWCESQGVRWPPAGSRAYEAIVDGRPMIADDAEVAVIAAHAARFVLDILSVPGRSKFPYSLYAVGMSAEWAFAEPFQTYPIPLEGTHGWGEMDGESVAENLAVALQILSTVLPKKPEQNEPPAAA